MSIIVIVIILTAWLWGIKHDNGHNALGFRVLLILTVIKPVFIDLAGNGDFILKVAYLITALWYFFRKGHGISKTGVAVVLISFVMFGVSLINASWSESYGLSAAITAFTSFVTGLFLYGVSFSSEERSLIAHDLVLLPLYSVIMGIPLALLGAVDFLGRSGTALAGASTDTNLAFFATIAIMTEISFFGNHRKYTKYNWINLAIAILTQTRMSIVVSILLMIPQFLRLILVILTDIKKLALVILSGALLVKPLMYIYTSIMERTFVDGQINTSGRTDAWSYILSLIHNKWTGNGYGNLKTLTDNPRLAAFTAAHNEYVRAYFETGYLGLALLALILIVILMELLSKQRYSGNWRNFRRFPILLTFIGFLIYSYTDNTIVNFHFFFPFLLSLNISMEDRVTKRLLF